MLWQRRHDRYEETGVAFDEFTCGACPMLGGWRPARCAAVSLVLNMEGSGEWGPIDAPVTLGPRCGCIAVGNAEPIRMVRTAHEHHRFIMVSFSLGFLRQHLQPQAQRLHPLLMELNQRDGMPFGIDQPKPLSGRLLELAAGLSEPPVSPPALDLWYAAKAMELCAEFLFVAPPDAGLFCSRRKRVAQERTERVRAVLREHLAEPLSLEEVARRVGCSPHHLSRTFSSVAGCTIPQYLRQLRLERAAELLRSGRYNVTETSLEVGYASLSHFIQAFQETYGCPPGAYAQGADSK